MVFTSVRDAETANSMQLAGIQFFGDVMPPMENADFDGSGLVDGNDFLILQRNMNMAGSQMDGDANGDGQVNAADLDIWEMQYGGAPPAAAVATAVPEPASAALLLLAACGVTAIAGRRSLRR